MRVPLLWGGDRRATEYPAWTVVFERGGDVVCRWGTINTGYARGDCDSMEKLIVVQGTITSESLEGALLQLELRVLKPHLTSGRR